MKGHWRFSWPRAGVLACGLALSACGGGSSQDPPTWRADCPPPQRPAPLSLEAARAVQRVALRRDGLRLREAAAPGFLLREVRTRLDPQRIAAGELCVSELADLGQLLFDHEYNFADGLGRGDAASAPAGPFHRVHRGLMGGPETISCPSCHWVGGPNGAGAETDNALLQGDGERVPSSDARNPPALIGLGVVEALAREMTHELQAQRANFLRTAGRGSDTHEARLSAKGVDFGVLRLTAKGELDTSGLSGIDADLVVKPFGWKGTLAEFIDFASDAFQVHLGIQSDRLLAAGNRAVVGEGKDPADPDADGVQGELDRGPLAAMAVQLALLELPIVEPLIQDRDLPPAAQGLLAPMTTSFVEQFRRGRQEFHALGCAGCHQPMMILESPILALDGMPPIDLGREMQAPALQYDPAAHGYPVWLFSDLKRHDMGPINEARHEQNGVAPRMYLTPRLWGVADSAPYLHDGRAPSFDYAIAGHDGDGAVARAAFAALSQAERAPLRVYLMSLRRAPRLTVP